MMEMGHYDPGHDRLSHWLLWDMLVGRGLVLQKDNSLCKVIEFRPADLDARPRQAVQQAAHRFATKLAQLTTRYTVHLDILDDDGRDFPDGYRSGEAAPALVHAERKADQTAENALFDDRFFLTVTLTPEDADVQGLERLLVRNGPVQKAVDHMVE